MLKCTYFLGGRDAIPCATHVQNFQCYLLGGLNIQDVSSAKLQESVEGS